MPIRMVEDENVSDNSDNGGNQNPGGGGGGGGMNLGCLMMFLPMIMKRPKLFIPLILIGVVIYFFMGNPLSNISSSSSGGYATGGEMKQEIFDKAEVFEPLADNAKNPLPEKFSLQQYCPTPLNQGSQGSCVAWSSAYAARTILESQSKGIPPNSTTFSPSYLYNQIALEGCQGSYVNNAMEVMHKGGLAKLEDFPYNEDDCSKRPTQYALQSAAQFKTRGYNRLTKNGDDYNLDLLAMKQHIAHGAPVVIGMMVGGSFMQEMVGKDQWRPNSEDYDMPDFGGHAMCVMGYDDYKAGGSFQIMNSWGTDWGNKGFCWVTYKDFKHFGKEAYGLYPMGKAIAQDENKLDVSFGLVNNETKKNIALKAVSNGVYKTSNLLKKGSKFKVEITNSADCYVYIFGLENDNSNYTLFPYTAKHSPYCGIQGTRLFPKDHSMLVDNDGVKDKIAILVTKKPIDFKDFNAKLNANKSADFITRFNQLIAPIASTNTTFKTGENISFSSLLNGKNAVGVVVEVEKF
jgi:hypothetical protein